MLTAASPAPATPAAARRLAMGFLAAQIGANLSFLPLLNILLPMQAELVDPAGKAALLSRLMFYGALTASAANLAAGWLSDRTPGRWGRRRPWIVLGAVAAAAAYGLVGWARTPGQLFAAVVALQVALNAFLSPLLALFAERFQPPVRVRLASLVSLASPLASLVGALMVRATLPLGSAAPYLAIGAVLLATVAPFGLSLGDAPAAASAVAPPGARWKGRFAAAWLWRLQLVFLLYLIQPFMLFYLQDRIAASHLGAAAAADALAWLTALYAAAFIAAALACGRVVDRRGGRPLLVLSALLLAAAAVVYAFAHGWAVVAAGYLLFGAGAGAFHVADLVLSARVLSGPRSTARDMGLLNLANTLPQMFAPALALTALGVHAQAYSRLFLLAAALGAAASLTAIRIRGDAQP